MALFVILAGVTGVPAFAQGTCTSNPTTVNANINFGSIVWTAGGGATVAECQDMADGLITFTGNVIVDVANNTAITITNDVNINGSFPISGGVGSLLRVNGGFTLHVTGDLGDPDNNGVQYEVTTVDDAIIVEGTLYGKNDNAFTGDGTISGGTLDVKNGSTCGNPCPVSGGFDNCQANGTFCADNGVLPIALLSFTAKKEDDGVLLYWETIMEDNFDRFIVERSSDGLAFLEIGEVPGAGRNIQDIVSRYSFEDHYPLAGFNYYRLKSLDFDLRFDYSKIVSAKLVQEPRFWVHPNPSHGSIHYYMNFSPSDGDRVILLNQLGKPLFEKSAHFYNEAIETGEGLSPGIYFLRYCSQSGAQYSTRVVVK